MVRLDFVKACTLAVCAAASLASGCTANRSLSRALRLSPVEMDGRVVESQDRLSTSDDEPDEPVEFSLATLRTTANPADEEKVSSDDEFELDEQTVAGTHLRHAAASTARAVQASEEFLAVLMTGYDEPLAEGEDTVLVAARRSSDDFPTSKIRFQVPAELPGSEAPALRVPPMDPNQSFEERKAQIGQLYGSVPELPIPPDDDLSLPSWTLSDLEHVAWENHPGLMQAAAQMEVARGGMIQAGLHPNPTVGWEQDTIANGIQGYNGPFWAQTIVTGGKLKLARCAAAMEYENAKLAYQRTKIDIATRVRDAYYDLLVSQQRRRMLLALARLMDEIYQAQIELVAGGQAAAYEPMQVRVFAVQARNAVIEAQNSVIAAGRRLGAAAGMPEVEVFQIAGETQDAPTSIAYDAAKAYLLENHTELRSVRNRVVQSQHLSRLEYIRPRIPDISYYQTVQHSNEVGPFVNSYNLQIGAPIPIFDRNQGNILATESSVISHERAYGALQNDLTGQLAQILARYETARAQAVNYRRQILPDQVRTYRGIYSRYREAGPGANDNINFGDVIIAQQTLGTVVVEYANVLSAMWQAYVDAAEVLQIEDLPTLDAWFGLGS